MIGDESRRPQRLASHPQGLGVSPRLRLLQGKSGGHPRLLHGIANRAGRPLGGGLRRELPSGLGLADDAENLEAYPEKT